MKKVIFAFAIATALVSCGGNATTEKTTNCDSTCVDSTKVSKDTTTVKADSTKVDTLKAGK